MASMYFFLFFFLLTVLFVGMVWFERKRNKKFFEGTRAKFDVYVKEQQSALASLDIIQALEYIMRYLALQMSHLIVGILHFVAKRSERVLRKARRKLHAAQPQDEPSQYVKAMKGAKDVQVKE
jgi:signal transduction histidine kinase